MTPRSMEEIVKVLQQSTPLDEIRYLPKHLGGDGTAMALPYFDARFTHGRLDAACGPFGWQTDVKDIRGFVCVGIGILNPDNGTWVWRWDTGQEDQNEATGEGDAEDGEDDIKDIGGAKAIVSRGIKRAGVQLGIGRDIYDLPKVRCKVRVNAKGKFAAWDEDVAAAIAARRRIIRPPPPPMVPVPVPPPPMVPVPVPLPGPDAGGVTIAEATELTEPPNPTASTDNGGSKRLIASNAFAEHVQSVHAHRDQISAAIAEVTGADGKTDWIAAIPALDRIMAASGTESPS